MPLEGSLKALGIAEIIQFPSATRRSGRLLVERDDQRAEFFYVMGELHHATLGERQGFPVLVEILPWQRGRFLFEPDIPCPVRTIDMDLGRALLQATWQGEESGDGGGAEAEAGAGATEAGAGVGGAGAGEAGAGGSGDMHVLATACLQAHFGPTWDPAVFARLCTFVAEHPVFFYACVMNRRGHVRAEFVRPVDGLEGPAETYMLLRDIMKNYALCCEERMVIKSSHCTVAMQPFGEDQVILGLASPEEDVSETEQAIAVLTKSLEDPLAL